MSLPIFVFSASSLTCDSSILQKDSKKKQFLGFRDYLVFHTKIKQSLTFAHDHLKCFDPHVDTSEEVGINLIYTS